MAMNETQVDVVVVGGGQAGLAMGYYLQQQRRSFVILDAGVEIGHSWRDRWDSLKLFTPAAYDSLPGLRFPAGLHTFPTKDDVAAYLARYVATFQLPVRLNQRVTSVTAKDEGYYVLTEANTYCTRCVVIATGPFHQPYVPAFSHNLSESTVQIHTSQYRSPSQMPQGPVLVVGGGNSGVQIAEELAQTHDVTLSIGRRSPYIPPQIARRLWFWRNYLWLSQRISVDSPLGRVMREQDVLVGTSPGRLRRTSKVRVVGRALGVTDGRIYVQGGEMLNPKSIIWATGFSNSYPWLDAPVFDSRGRPAHRKGVTRAPGLYFLGLFWQTYAGSSLLGGVGRDAAMIAAHIAAL